MRCARMQRPNSGRRMMLDLAKQKPADRVGLRSIASEQQGSRLDLREEPVHGRNRAAGRRGELRYLLPVRTGVRWCGSASAIRTSTDNIVQRTSDRALNGISSVSFCASTAAEEKCHNKYAHLHQHDARAGCAIDMKADEGACDA